MRLITNYGIYKISEEQAEKMVSSSEAMVKIEGNYIQRKEVKAILGEDKFPDYLHQHRKWECKYGKVHHQDDDCQCQYEKGNQQ